MESKLLSTEDVTVPNAEIERTGRMAKGTRQAGSEPSSRILSRNLCNKRVRVVGSL